MSKTFGRAFSRSGLECLCVLGYVEIAETVAGGSDESIRSISQETGVIEVLLNERMAVKRL